MTISLGERTAETAAIFFQKSQAPVIRRTLPMKAKTLEEALADFQDTQKPGAKSFGRTIYVDGRYVGDVWCYGMDPSGDPQAMVSYGIFAPELWGKGAATTALGLFLEEIRARFGLERIGAFTFARNTASVRVLEKNGFLLSESLLEDGVESGYYLRQRPITGGS